MQENWIVRTKLLPPRLRSPLLERPHLTARLAQGLSVSLIVVQASAGYGKSTTVAAFLAGRREPSAWYSLAEGDADPLLFGTHLIGAAEDLVPGTIKALTSLVRQAQQGKLPWAIVYDRLNNQLLEGLKHDAWLVLDDFHLVADQLLLNPLLNRFLAHLPPRLHVILTMRHRLDLPILTRALAQSYLITLNEEDLALTSTEIEVLFKQHYGVSLTPDQLDRLSHETEGWIMALQLLAHQLRDDNAGEVEKVLGDLPGHLDALFELLTTSVINRQSAEMQNFLYETSILHQLDAAACDAVHQKGNGATMLAELQEAGLSMVVIDEETCRHHHLVRELLQRHLRSDEATWRTLHRRAAAHFEQINLSEESIYHLLKAKEFEAAAHKITSIARELIEAGRFTTLGDWLKQLPSDLLARHPDLGVVQGDVARLTSRYDAAQTAYRQAEVAYRNRGNVLGESRALEGQARVYIDTVYPAPVQPLLKKALRVLGRGHPTKSAHLLQLMAENATNQGRSGLAKHWLAAAERLEVQIDPEIKARIHLRCGELAVARALLEAVTTQTGSERLARTHREPSLLLAFLQALLGEAEEARLNAEIGLRLAGQLESPFTEAVAHMRLGHAWQLPPLPDLERAQKHYREAIRLVRSLGVARGEAEPQMGLALLHTFAGQSQAANEAIERGISIVKRSGDAWTISLLRLALGINQTLYNDPEIAQATLLGALHAFEQCGDAYGSAVSRLWLVWLAYQYDQNDLFAAHAPLWLAQAEAYPTLLTQATLFGPRDPQQLIPILLSTGQEGVLPESVLQVLTQMNLPTDLTYHPGYTLHVRTLGQFHVQRGNSPVVRREWQREKARHLFQLLLINRGNFLQREQIIEQLWPDLEPKATENHFKVALNALQSVLEPGRPQRELPFFVQRQGTTYGLNPVGAIELDTEVFERLIAEADSLKSTDPVQAMARYQQALALYEGDFLPEALYEDWSSAERERLQLLALGTMTTLAELLVEPNPGEAIRLVRRVLATDPVWEDAYRVLMRAYLAQGNRPMALRTYQRCVEMLEREFGVAPLPETEALYEEIARRAL